MKHSLKRAVASILCASLLGGAMAFMGCAAADTTNNRLAMEKPTYSFDLLASEKPEINSSIPIGYMDLTTYYSFAGPGNVEFEVTEGSHTTFTATADDPLLNLYVPEFKPSECKSVAIIYRTDMDKDGELYCNRSDGVQMGQKGGIQVWRWIPTKEFAKMAVVCDAWKDCDESVAFTGWRFDPLNPRIEAGDSIDIRCIAFFDTEDGAERFNYDEYKKLLDWENANPDEAEKEEEETGMTVDWADPAYKDMETTPEDSREGSLTFTESEDGSTVTVSYKVGDETKFYTVPNNPINRFGGYAGTDDLGRSLYDASQVGVIGDKGERYVGMFYFLWHGKHAPTDKIYNLQEILDSTPDADKGKLSTGKYGGVGEFHWFGEPLYGYYYINDEWVLRKHMELLTNAGVDFLFFDTTNNHTHADTALKIMKILHEMNEQGYDAPGVVFYTNTNAATMIKNLYNEIYAQNLYPDTWFCIDGKPVMIGPADANIDDFFTMKINQWPTERENHVNAWPWMDGKRPQYIYKDSEGNKSAINVSVAQHRSTWRFSDSIYDKMDRGNLGRSYGEAKLNEKLTEKYYDAIAADPELYKQGLNFQAQWDAAHKADVPFVLVTGWNEWIAQRQSTSTEYAHFVDLASVEFSRDIEMMKGGYFDNYYMQLAFNVQKYKGAAPTILQDARNPINITGGFDQWDAVQVTYTDYARDCLDRDFNGYGNQVYTDTTGRNDFTAFKITHDTKNVYFYAETRFDITKPDGESSWMQLFIDADQNAATGWYGYDYIVNYAAKDEFTTTVARYNGTDNAFSYEVIGEVSYRVKGNQMMIAVPLDMLGVQHPDYMNFHFKWVDSDSRITTMEQFYTEGDVAPLGRLNYVFNTVMPGSVPPAEEDTEAPTEAPIEGDVTEGTAPEESTEGEDVTETPKKGCGSSLLTSAAVTVAAAALAVGVSKKKENE
ncbi:MAG: hypothetical protein J6M42_03335 [Clostridia bacterium]|nr:hypothetical protein [Clostridia bacterium]